MHQAEKLPLGSDLAQPPQREAVQLLVVPEIVEHRLHGPDALAVASSAERSGQSERSGLPRPVALRWAQRLKRVFGIEIERCGRCGARLKIVASIEDPGVIARILAQGDHASDRSQAQRVLHAARAPPGQWGV